MDDGTIRGSRIDPVTVKADLSPIITSSYHVSDGLDYDMSVRTTLHDDDDDDDDYLTMKWKWK